MRVSTNNAFASGVSSLQGRQNDLQEAQQRLTSGKRIQRASDDPTGAARAERAMANINRIDATQRSLESSRNAMQVSEGAMGDAVELMQQIRETLVSAGNGSYKDSDRAVLANRLAGLRESLLAVANRPNGTGGYLFGGQGASSPPFLDTTGGVTYQGTAGAIRGSQDENMPLSVDGAAAWLQAPSGNGIFETKNTNSSTAWIGPGTVTDPSKLALTTGTVYSVQFTGAGATSTYTVLKDGAPTAATGAFKPGQSIQVDGMAVTIQGAPADGDSFDIVPSSDSLSIFQTLDNTINDLTALGRTTGQVSQTVTNGLRDLDASLARMLSVRSELGEAMNGLDGTESRFASQKLYSQTEKSNAEDLDMVQGISDFQGQQTGYDAALKAYSMVQRLTLFQYLNG
nr:flagellar hook-associated protein FlgL [uncultured Roseateles sp.]